MATRKNPNQKYNWWSHLDFILLDIFALQCAFAAAFALHFDEFVYIDVEAWENFAVLIGFLDCMVILLTGGFTDVMTRKKGDEFISTALNAIYNFILCCIVLYSLKIGIDYSRITVVSMYLLYTAFSFFLRIGWKKLLRRLRKTDTKIPAKTMLVVGKREDMPQLLRSINSGFFQDYAVKTICVMDAPLGEKITTEIDIEDENGDVQKKRLVFENAVRPEGIVRCMLREHIDELFVNVNPSDLDSKIFRTLVENGKGIHLNIMPMFGFTTDDQFISTVGTNKTLSVGVYAFSGRQLVYLALKRCIDLVAGIVGVVCMVPMTILIKLSYLMTGDTKSIFYTQVRVGVNGKPFQMYKYRTMVHNAEELLPEILKNEQYLREWEENQKIENDPRITRAGRLLRKFSLDEFPQFINVLRGDMSLIGPRPLIEGELEQHGGLQLYQQVKPGLTGWWGCNGRSNTTYEERLELEYYYVKNCSLKLDILCTLRTLEVIVQGKGAK